MHPTARRAAIGWLPAETTEISDLAEIGAFFGLETTSEMMSRITGLSPSSLSRVANGQTIQTGRWQHVAVVAAYVRELRSLLDEISQGQPGPRHSMARWLVSAHIPTSHGRLIAIDALSDPILAREALAGIRSVSS